MELNRFTDYALRSMIYAGLHTDRLTSIREIAEAFSISEAHLVKVVYKLSTLNYLETFRGRGGGLRLARDPAEINIGEVVRATEPLDLVECMSKSGGNCCLRGICELQSTLIEARSAFLAVLDKRTLADLIANEAELSRRLKS